MIFVTVGEQLPFDRLIMTVDNLVLNVQEPVFAQIGNTSFRPYNIEYSNYLTPKEYRKHFSAADCIIAHAGMGTIITALELQKPIIVMPREKRLGEHRNDHQFATVEKFRKYPNVIVASNTDSLKAKLMEINCIKKINVDAVTLQTSPKLLDTIREFIQKN